MRSVADFCYSHRRLVLAGWVVLIVSAYALSAAFAGKYRTDFKLPGSESQAALDLLKERGVSSRTGFGGQIVFQADQGVRDPAVRQSMESLFTKIESGVAGADVVSPYDPQNGYQISADGKIAYAELNLADRTEKQYETDADYIKALREEVSVPGLQVELGGDIFATFSQPASEFIGVMAAIVILLIAFGSLLAMGLPIVTALFGVGTGAALIGLLTNVLAVPNFTTQVAALIGIGVGIDYALLIVTRYRRGLKDGLEPRRAVLLALDTSGRAVVFAGLTVVISLLGMFMMNMDFMRSVSLSAVLAVLLTMLAAVTLLPALLGFAGRNIDRFSVPLRSLEGQESEAFWYRWSRIMQAHPWPALIISTAVLVALAIPVFSLRLGFSDAGNRLTSDTTRRAYDLLSQGFGPGFNGPLLVVVDLPNGAADQPKLTQLAADLRETEGVASVAEPQVIPQANLSLINVFPTTAPQDKETADLVHRVRDRTIPNAAASSGLKPLVAGLPAGIIDFSDYTGRRLPIFFGAVLILSFLLLMTVFHSVVVPLKAVVMNMLSIGASFGVMVAVFQWGFLASLFGLGKPGPIEAWGPMMMFAIVFGLSMDYEVFLLSRVREEYDKHHDNRTAVADGLASTGRVISAAAAIMVCVFGAFVLGDDRSVKLIGFGLAFAIFIDATVVRLVLVPATMELLGDLNWWMPKWLGRRLPKVHVEGEEVLREAAASAGGGDD
jgi:RND superfamily putative drug exporter